MPAVRGPGSLVTSTRCEDNDSFHSQANALHFRNVGERASRQRHDIHALAVFKTAELLAGSKPDRPGNC